MVSQEEKKSKTRQSIDDEKIDRVLICSDAGMGATEIVKVTGIPTATVQRIIRAEKIVRNENWDGAVEFLRKMSPPKYLERAAKRYNVTIPECVFDPPEEEPQGMTPEQLLTVELPPVQPVAKKNEDLYLAKLIETLVKQNELIEQLMDVVIPKYIIDLKDNVNANTDLISERLKNCESRLDKIVANTRKRGA